LTANPVNAQVAANFDRYRRIADLARRARAADLDSTLAYVGAAAHSAWLHHPGFFADRDLERLAHRGEQTPPPSQPAAKSGTEHVLHVFTQTYDIGGHTRLAERWMELDFNRDHSVVLTWQAQASTPESLATVVKSRHGHIRYLDRRPGGLSTRAARLERLAADFDYVVLHTHPSDPIPLAAFGGRKPAPVLLVNHADHVFWLGTTTADLVISIREAGKALNVARRGLAAHRNVVLPIPVQPGQIDAPSMEQAKAKLGIPSDAALLLTVASAYKFTESIEPGFAALHAEILRHNPGFHHVVVGVDPGSEPWTTALSASGGRLKAVDPTPDLESYLAAADVYVDSFPFASLTSVVEAMSRGVPCVSFDPFNGTSPVLRLGDDGDLAPYYEGPDLTAYGEAIRDLGNHRRTRTSAGSRALDVVRSRHWGEGWMAQLENAYSAANEAAAGPPYKSADAQTGTVSDLDRNLAAFQAAQLGHGARPRLVSEGFLSALPRREAVGTLGLPPTWSDRLRIATPDWTMFGVGRVTRAYRALLHPRFHG